MSYRNIELFCDVVAHQSFSKAAEARGLSQPAVSQALHALEERLGLQLIDRSKRPFELTAAGRYYYEQCTRILEQLRLVDDEVQSFVGKVAGRLRVVSIYSVGLLQMKTYTQRYRAAYPSVSLRLDYSHPDQLYARILRDEADLGIVSFPRDGGEIGCVEWLRQEMVIVGSPDHRWRDRTDISLGELEGEPFVAFSADLSIRSATDKLLRKNRVTVNLVHEFDNAENVKRAVEIGLGVACLPLATVRRELDFGTLHSLRLSDVRFERPLGIVHKRHKHLSTAAARFIELLHEQVPEDSSPIPFTPPRPPANSPPPLNRTGT